MNGQLLEYSLKSLQRERFKNFFVFFILTLLTALLASMLFISASMKKELNLTLDGMPDIIISAKKAGMQTPIDERVAFEFLEIPGVSMAQGRVWGYYFFQNAGVYFSLIGIDIFEPVLRASLEKLLIEQRLDEESMAVGEGVQKVLTQNYYKEYFNFIKEDGSLARVSIGGSFKPSTALESNDLIVMSKERLRDIFGLAAFEATDIALSIANPKEVPTIALKISQNYPHLSLVSKEDIRVSYENIFNYKSGLFLGLYTIAFFTFFIIIYDKLTAMSSAQKREIGILKAIGWSVSDVLQAKLYEGLIVSTMSYMLGVFLALFFVYILKAPLLDGIFIGYSQMKPAFELLFTLDVKVLFLLFILSVPLYVLATIIPSWRVATLDAEEVMR